MGFGNQHFSTHLRSATLILLFKMKSSSVIFALAATGNAAILARDAATVLSDIDTINSDTQSLTSTVNAFSGISDAAALIAAESGLSDAIKKGTTDAKATTSVSDSEAQSILSAVKGLIPNIVAALNAVVSKDAAFTSAGVQSVVAGDLASLRTESSDFAAALIAAAQQVLSLVEVPLLLVSMQLSKLPLLLRPLTTLALPPLLSREDQVALLPHQPVNLAQQRRLLQAPPPKRLPHPPPRDPLPQSLPPRALWPPQGVSLSHTQLPPLPQLQQLLVPEAHTQLPLAQSRSAPTAESLSRLA